MSRVLFNKAIYSTTAYPQTTNGASFVMSGIDWMTVQPLYTNATPTAKVVASASISGNIWTSTAHGFTTGLVVRVSTSSALPTPLLVATDYYVIRLSDNTFSLASSLNNANAGTAITLSDAGTGNQTVTPSALSAVVKLQASDDATNWVDISGLTVSISAAGTTMWSIANPAYAYLRPVITITAGNLSLTLLACATAMPQTK